MSTRARSLDRFALRPLAACMPAPGGCALAEAAVIPVTRCLSSGSGGSAAASSSGTAAKIA